MRLRLGLLCLPSTITKCMGRFVLVLIVCEYHQTVGQDEITAMESHINKNVYAALYCPDTGIVSLYKYTISLTKTAIEDDICAAGLLPNHNRRYDLTANTSKIVSRKDESTLFATHSQSYIYHKVSILTFLC
ncbi:hypothetical protein BASA61_005021 [Batrachochytrium salamandrivorans]|nr:hypothetical protein BASA60_009628 [Batrachochytrium salamandrivorans]KAH6591226.1 hypothetical protein BASA61_005021 [Batrachochytrium salamandrivorans]KAH9272133.1 hypothetical protein BASA83_005724 [Batrachochytrium salamandrivorans]